MPPSSGPEEGLHAEAVALSWKENSTQSSVKSWSLSETSRQYSPTAALPGETQPTVALTLPSPVARHHAASYAAPTSASPKRQRYAPTAMPSSAPPDTRTSVPPVTGPRLGLSEATAGRPCVRKRSSFVVYCWPLSETCSDTAPSAAFGLWHTIVAASTTDAFVKSAPKRQRGRLPCRPNSSIATR